MHPKNARYTELIARLISGGVHVVLSELLQLGTLLAWCFCQCKISYFWKIPCVKTKKALKEYKTKQC